MRHYGGLVVLQFSTTRSRDGRTGLLPALNTLRFLWQNRYSALIRAVNHSPFSHLDLVLPNGCLVGASNSPNAPALYGNPRGVAVRPPDYQEFGIRRQMRLFTPYAGEIYRLILGEVDKPFDNGALRSFLSPHFPDYRDWRDPNQWFCAELIIWAFERAGYYGGTMPWPKERCSPTDCLVLHLNDPNWINRDTFWGPIPGLTLPYWES